MPDDTKKNQSKGRNDPKEQRRKRQNRQPVTSADKKEKTNEVPKVPVTEKSAPVPVYEPPPEFYKNLKRETDEILKITEEENAKYKKKEIQSNWAKYEMPIETYEEIDEQESLGADYQALVDASLSVGGHFQFKHEKSWDANTGPSPYDKYFNVNMDNLNLALCSIPFYERNNIDTCIFSEIDIQTMNHRSVKYKQKYNDDKKYTTQELDAQDKILNSLTESDERNEPDQPEESSIEELSDGVNNIDLSVEKKSARDDCECHLDIPVHEKENERMEGKDNVELVIDVVTKEDCLDKVIDKVLNKDRSDEIINEDKIDKVFNKVDIIMDYKEMENKSLRSEVLVSKDESPPTIIEETKAKSNVEENIKTKDSVPIKEQTKNPAIESPEDLEKWLDDFLDG